MYYERYFDKEFKEARKYWDEHNLGDVNEQIDVMLGKRKGISIFPDTRTDMTFVYYNANPKGIRTGDCVIRGISYFLGMTWIDTLHSLVDWGAERGLVMFHYRGFYNKYLAEKGYSKKKVPNKEWTVNDFCEQFAKDGKCYLIQCPRHITVIHDKDIIDTWNCGRLKVLGFWEKS